MYRLNVLCAYMCVICMQMHIHACIPVHMHTHECVDQRLILGIIP